MTCALHCLLAPFIVMAAPFLAGVFENELVEFGILIGSLICGLVVIISGYCQHKYRHVISLYIFGALMWGLHFLFEHWEFPGAKLVFLFGTFIVLFAYYINHKQLQCCITNHSHE